MGQACAPKPKKVCPVCGANNKGIPSCCGIGGAWRGRCGKEGSSKPHTWGEGLVACAPKPKKVCPVCGANNKGIPSCCGIGGAWRGRCGKDGSSKPHTWDEGLESCTPDDTTTT